MKTQEPQICYILYGDYNLPARDSAFDDMRAWATPSILHDDTTTWTEFTHIDNNWVDVLSNTTTVGHWWIY